ncbi:MAG TPA: RNA-binding protein [Elusimicrobia bacterium]|nr:MAG: hypothetical protein A2X37_01370 [Elusimicrobia bacterium GWA2_66_18]OGR76000.1 MAG: hypothetical protein A2X40_08650 [Elusimicrobia bacterium GWC2_65_9]HAZ08379.1 RNA-binding protein [Elusimicrobiota bacterium]
MKDLALFIIQRLAGKPEAASVTEFMDGDTAVLKLVVAEEDKGKIIGKQGKVVKAIRSLVGVAASKAGKKAVVEID